MDRRYVFAALPLLAILAYALVSAGWHGRLDVAGGFLLGILVTTAVASMNRARSA